MADLDHHTLYRGAREYFTWPITATDANGQPITLDDIGVGVSDSTEDPPATYTTAPVTGGKLTVLLAGGTEGAGNGATVLPVGRNVLWTQVDDTPEVIPRPLASIRVP